MPPEEQEERLPLMNAYRFAAQHSVKAEIDEIRTMDIDPRLIKKNKWRTVKKGYMVSLLQSQDLWNQFVQEQWPTGNTSWGKQRTEHYLLWKSRNEESINGEPDDDGPEEIIEQAFEFEYELRNFLKNNLHTIEPGLKLYKNADRDGIEFLVDNGHGRIDVLAVDKNGRFVVIELKLSKGRNKTVGQLLYYMGWVDANLDQGPCRGMIVAREISTDLILAVQRVSGLALFRYKVNLSIEQVPTASSKA